jgi:hypothetical protein
VNSWRLNYMSSSVKISTSVSPLNTAPSLQSERLEGDIGFLCNCAV